ncbi:MAG: tyrosine-type recombinase/integrase [Prevotellaceae bacterium]|jgi:site-specific recombinase XerD|nr:tyrosine-type recombinase/integrase [Prevotellaceae bacterium]
MLATYNFVFNRKKQRLAKGETALVQLRVTINRVVRFFFTGISQNLTFHMARHTFATTVMLMQGVSLEVTQKALGHSDIKTTQIYAKMVDTRVAEEMGKLDENSIL